jgi:hypothetical protein
MLVITFYSTNSSFTRNDHHMLSIPDTQFCYKWCCSSGGISVLRTQSSFVMRRLLDLPLQSKYAVFYFQIRFCCQSNFLHCLFIALADVETITKVWLKVKQPEGVINNEQRAVNYTFPRYFSTKISVSCLMFLVASQNLTEIEMCIILCKHSNVIFSLWKR